MFQSIPRLFRLTFPTKEQVAQNIQSKYCKSKLFLYAQCALQHQVTQQKADQC